MKVSTKGRYALSMLIDLAEHRYDGFIPLKDIAERQGISKNYLEQIISLLKNTDILSANRGFQGGYKLAKSPEQYTVGQILRVTEGGMSPVVPPENAEDERSGSRMLRGVWEGLDRAVSNYLDNITLQSILDNYGNYDAADQYYI